MTEELSVKEAARVLGRAPSAVEYWIRHGMILATRRGRRVLVSVDALEKFKDAYPDKVPHHHFGLPVGQEPEPAEVPVRAMIREWLHRTVDQFMEELEHVDLNSRPVLRLTLYALDTTDDDVTSTDAVESRGLVTGPLEIE